VKESLKNSRKNLLKNFSFYQASSEKLRDSVSKNGKFSKFVKNIDSEIENLSGKISAILDFLEIPEPKQARNDVKIDKTSKIGATKISKVENF
jgi:hypothetical protein